MNSTGDDVINATAGIQTAEELDEFYASSDPWEYDHTGDDHRRKRELLALLPRRSYGRTLDIGCGNGFLTGDLPGDQVLGVDISRRAIEWARERAVSEAVDDRLLFEVASLFDLNPDRHGTFDLIVITGVLYSQYIGKGAPLVRILIDSLLRERGILACCHIADWQPLRFAYTVLDTILYPYREFTHRLEVYQA